MNLSKQVLAYDFRYNPVNPKHRRLCWFRFFFGFLNMINSGYSEVFFDSVVFKVDSFQLSQHLILKIKPNIVFTKKWFPKEDGLYLFYVLLSFFPMSPRQYKPKFLDQCVSDDPEMKLYLDRILHPKFRPSSWVQRVLKLLFDRSNPTIVIPVNPKPLKWLREKEWGKKRFRFGGSSFLVVRSLEFSVHFFYYDGGHFIFTLPRNDQSIDDLQVLFHFGSSPRWSCLSMTTLYKTCAMPRFFTFLK